MRNICFTIILYSIVILNSYAQEGNTHIDPFHNPPSTTPEIFCKDVISIENRYEYGLAISPDYSEIFFTADDPGDGLMCMRKNDNGDWTYPTKANIRGNNSWEYEAFYSADGKKLLFISDIDKKSKLWTATKNGINWVSPIMMDSPINDTDVFWATMTNDNTIYYTNLSVFSIFKSRLIDNKYSAVESANIAFGIHPYVSRDEKYILFNAKKDIYISYRNDKNGWGDPVKLNNLVNTVEYQETCPSLSPDGKFLFFSRYNDKNGKCDIYWVSSEVLHIQ